MCVAGVMGGKNKGLYGKFALRRKWGGGIADVRRGYEWCGVMREGTEMVYVVWGNGERLGRGCGWREVSGVFVGRECGWRGLSG